MILKVDFYWFFTLQSHICKVVSLLENMSSHLPVKKILLDVLVKVGQRVQNG